MAVWHIHLGDGLEEWWKRITRATMFAVRLIRASRVDEHKALLTPHALGLTHSLNRRICHQSWSSQDIITQW